MLAGVAAEGLCLTAWWETNTRDLKSVDGNVADVAALTPEAEQWGR